jgi:Tfp pilus assembly protein PilO
MNDRRLIWLKVAAAVTVGLLVLDQMVLTPAMVRWREQSDRLEVLRREVREGQALLAREAVIRERWDEMQRRDLPEDGAEAENEVFKAVARWGRAGRITFTGLNPQWRAYEDGYSTLECRASATGDQAGIAQFLEELETDPLAVRLETFEISAVDEQGRRLNLAARFTALRIGLEPAGRP